MILVLGELKKWCLPHKVVVSLLTAGLLFNCPPRPLPVLGTEPGSHRCFSMEARGPKSLWESLELKDTTSAVGVCKRISQVSLRARSSGAGQFVLRQGLCLTRTHQFSGYPSSWGLACLWPLPPALGLQVILFSLFMQGLGTKLRSWCLYGKHLHMEWSPSPLANLALLSLLGKAMAIQICVQWKTKPFWILTWASWEAY